MLLTPIVVTINTEKGQYEIRLQGVVKASIEEHVKEILRIKLKIFLWTFYFYPLKGIHSNTKKKKTGRKPRKKNNKRFSFRKIIAVLRSFKIKHLVLDIDTGDNVFNAKLYPLVGFLNYNTEAFNINFEDRNQLVLQMYCRPIHIIKSFINQ
ncbi:hypothetical protein GCM10022258_35640 [Aquimarina gracilis]